MKRIDKINLIDRIARHLQSTMTYADIDRYLAAFGINTKKPTTDNGGSKWVYAKEILAGEPDDLILQIASELEIEHGYDTPNHADLGESKFWKTNHFKLFLSHLSTFKVRTAQLQGALKAYGISSFVAHEDIEPTREWQEEIEKALYSMDALAAILTPAFNESKWTDQEVGIAIGKDILVIPIRKGMDPYGFIGKYQGLQAQGKTVGQVAQAVFDILAGHAKTKDKLARCLVAQVVASADHDDAIHKLSLLRSIEALPISHLEKLVENCRGNADLISSDEFVQSLNDMLNERGIGPVLRENERVEEFDQDIPF